MAQILIIDDSGFQRGMVRKAVKALGHDTIEAGGGEQGLNLIKTDSPDCVLCDLLMPEIDGFMVLQTLQDRGSKTPVIVVTADIQESVHRKCLELGAVTVINKPVKGDQLQNALNSVLG